jgi:hypothetical protein
MAQKNNLKALFLLTLFAIFFLPLVSSREINCNLDKPTQLWHLNEGNGTNAVDSCYGYNATLNGDMNWTTGKYNNSVSFNGINTYLDAGNIYPFNQNMPEFSFSLWEKIPPTIAWQSIFRSGYYDPYSEFMELLQLNDGETDYLTFMGASSLGISTIDDNNWHNIIGTFNGTSQTSKLYIDGVFINEYTVGISEITATTTPLYFGFNFDNGFLMTGDLDEVSFYNRTLTQEEITSINHNFTQGINMSLALFTQDYPYVDFNVSYPIQVKVFKNGTELTDAIVFMAITDPYNVTTPLYLVYNPVSEFYEASVIFSKVGNYPFFIEANSLSEGYTNATGTFLVRKPYYINVKLFTNNGADDYINDYGYVTLEFLGTQKIDPYLENYIHPFADSRFIQPAFHSSYIDGEAQLKLWDKSNYAFRFFDGQVTFNGVYSQPNITKPYGTNIYLGNYYLNGTNSTYQFVLMDRELHPYRHLANWTFFIVLILTIFVGIALFFLFPQQPFIALIFTILLGVGAFVVRVSVWLFLNW